jgi:hypothetical protein
LTVCGRPHGRADACPPRGPRGSGTRPPARPARGHAPQIRGERRVGRTFRRHIEQGAAPRTRERERGEVAQSRTRAPHDRARMPAGGPPPPHDPGAPLGGARTTATPRRTSPPWCRTANAESGPSRLHRRRCQPTGLARRVARKSAPTPPRASAPYRRRRLRPGDHALRARRQPKQNELRPQAPAPPRAHPALPKTLVANGAGDLFGLAIAPSANGIYFVNDAGSGPARQLAPAPALRCEGKGPQRPSSFPRQPWIGRARRRTARTDGGQDSWTVARGRTSAHAAIACPAPPTAIVS